MTYLKQSLLENSYQFFLAYVKIDWTFEYLTSQLTANICKTKRIRDLKIVLMEKAVSLT